MDNIIAWFMANGVTVLLSIVAIEKFLQLLDKLLPESVTIDNHIADIIARIIKALNFVKK